MRKILTSPVRIYTFGESTEPDMFRQCLLFVNGGMLIGCQIYPKRHGKWFCLDTFVSEKMLNSEQKVMQNLSKPLDISITIPINY